MYGKYNGNASPAQKEYHQTFKNRQTASMKLLISIYRRLHERSNLRRINEGARRRVIGMEEVILARVGANSIHSTKELSQNFVTSHTTIWRILYRSCIHSIMSMFKNWYKVIRRTGINFVSSWINQTWTNISSVHINEWITRHFWVKENPYAVLESHSQFNIKVNIWMDILGISFL